MHGNLINNKGTNRTTSKLDKLIFIICTIDILFFPYIRIASASLSMILLPIWYLFNLKKIRLSSEFRLFMIFICIVILSVSMSAVTFPNSLYLKSNITNSTILLYGFLYYFFYKYYLELNINTQLKKLLVSYVLFGFTLATVYLVNPILYFQIRSFWTMSGNVIEVFDSLTIHRFTSTFSDPNNAAVVFVAVMTFLLLNMKTNLIQSTFIIGATGIIIFATMSSTGFVLFVLSILFYVSHLFYTKKILRFKRTTLLYLSLMFLLSPLLFLIIYKFFGSEVAQMSLDRVTGNSADSRFRIWTELLERENIFKYLIYGMGGTVIVDGIAFKPHNGHLHLIYNYGMIVYAIYIYIYFRKRKGTTFQSYFFLIPFLLGFTMNVGIYEPRFVTILSLLLASYASLNNSNFYTMQQQYRVK